jgi:hypothetical protein
MIFFNILLLKFGMVDWVFDKTKICKIHKIELYSLWSVNFTKCIDGSNCIIHAPILILLFRQNIIKILENSQIFCLVSTFCVDRRTQFYSHLYSGFLTVVQHWFHSGDISTDVMPGNWSCFQSAPVIRSFHFPRSVAVRWIDPVMSCVFIVPSNGTLHLSETSQGRGLPTTRATEWEARLVGGPAGNAVTRGDQPRPKCDRGVLGHRQIVMWPK